MQFTRARALELCESRGGRPGLPVPNNPYGLCGRKATLNLNVEIATVTASLPAKISLRPVRVYNHSWDRVNGLIVTALLYRPAPDLL